MMIASMPWLRLNTLSGMWQLLKRLRISWKMGRDYIHSPDKNYDDKLTIIEIAKVRAYSEPIRYPLLYLDEFSFYRQPDVTFAYESVGKSQPLGLRSYRSNTRSRVIGILDVVDGSVLHLQRFKIGVKALSDFYQDIANKYPNAEEISVVQDNWPVHFHPDVLARIKVQNFPYPPKVPENWPTEASTKAVLDNLPIQILCLPTYASWCNPIEKVWRFLRQEVLYLHRLSDQWIELKQRVDHFLYGFQDGSLDLLRYTGLLPIRDRP